MCDQIPGQNVVVYIVSFLTARHACTCLNQLNSSLAPIPSSRPVQMSQCFIQLVGYVTDLSLHNVHVSFRTFRCCIRLETQKAASESEQQNDTTYSQFTICHRCSWMSSMFCFVFGHGVWFGVILYSFIVFSCLHHRQANRLRPQLAALAQPWHRRWMLLPELWAETTRDVLRTSQIW